MMDAILENLPNFEDYCRNYVFVVKTDLTPLGTPFSVLEEASKYKKRLVKKGEKVSLQIVEINDLSEHVLPTTFEKFLKDNSLIYKKEA